MPTRMIYKNTRANRMQSQNGRPTSGHCVECGRVTNERDGGKRVTIPSQKNGVWMCANHRGTRNLNSYYDENDKRLGKGNADNISISIELESMGRSTHARAYLVDNGFIATSDSTVDIEYKSPIYTSELPLAKIVGGIEYMDKNPNYKFSVNNEHCGIHTHYGFIDNHFDFTTLYTHYEDLFKDLDKLVCDLPYDHKVAIFGRDFQTYNRELNFNYPDEHENWINIQHRYTLEIRMPRFVDARQYMRFLKCFKKIFKALNTHYISKDHTVANAKKAGRKMAMVFKKEYKEYYQPIVNNINNNESAISNIYIDDIATIPNFAFDLANGAYVSTRIVPSVDTTTTMICDRVAS